MTTWLEENNAQRGNIAVRRVSSIKISFAIGAEMSTANEEKGGVLSLLGAIVLILAENGAIPIAVLISSLPTIRHGVQRP